MTDSFDKLMKKQKRMEDDDTSNVDTEVEPEVTATGRPKRHATYVVMCSNRVQLGYTVTTT